MDVVQEELLKRVQGEQMSGRYTLRPRRAVRSPRGMRRCPPGEDSVRRELGSWSEKGLVVSIS